jgi:hypothetical protein
MKLPKIENRPTAEAPPPPAPSPFKGTGSSGLGPIAMQTKRQEHFDEHAVALAASLGWEGEPTLQIGGFAVADAQNFLRKTLHEIHNAVVAGEPCPDLSHVGEHLGLSGEHAAALLPVLAEIYSDEVAELQGLDPKALKRKLEANAAEDVEARKRARIAQAVEGA